MTALQRALLAWYRRHGRSKLPWRTARDPYRTLVSEFMLQQTQVDRVIPKFEAFIHRFPGFRELAAANVADVLRAWQGLGYNMRAVRLKGVADAVVERFGGEMPRETGELRSLEGVGPYTAAAIRSFAFDLDDAPVDTNVRRIVHRLFFGMEHPRKATQNELDAKALALVPPGNAHDWNSAMMDLGTAICTPRGPKCLICPLLRCCTAAPIDGAALDAARGRVRGNVVSVPFERTSRYARGRIVDRLRELAPGKRISLLDLHRDVQPLFPERTFDDVRGLVAALARDGLVALVDEEVSLP